MASFTSIPEFIENELAESLIARSDSLGPGAREGLDRSGLMGVRSLVPRAGAARPRPCDQDRGESGDEGCASAVARTGSLSDVAQIGSYQSVNLSCERD